MRAARASDVEQQLLGVWKLESYYMEFKTTGEKKNFFGEKPNGYLIFTPQKRMMALLTAEERKKPNTDEDRIAAFWSMGAYSGIYRVEGDKWTTKVDVAWTETWVGSDQDTVLQAGGRHVNGHYDVDAEPDRARQPRGARRSGLESGEGTAIVSTSFLCRSRPCPCGQDHPMAERGAVRGGRPLVGGDQPPASPPGSF